MLPGFLGQMQYHYGTFTLLKCVILILSIQVIVALPFLLGETSVSVYLEKSKLTGQGRNQFAYAEAFYDYLAADYYHSIFWRFVPEEIYFDQTRFACYLKPLILVLNVYHFFVRKNALPQCLINLF